jgi:dihydrofolate synthase/folylpolyglutamate synthase
MRFSTAYEWTNWIAGLHRQEMELGLDRVKMVAARLNVLEPTSPVIIVGGTNGKGSTVAGLEAIYRKAGYRVGAFTSPFLFKMNEQVRLDGREATDAEFCQAYEKVADALQDITLTPFEFTTLAALHLFKNNSLDVLILEVGLGGRLDAVNIIDADASVVTSIAIDHVEWLGDTREKIAHEKAGIFRRGKMAICGDTEPPSTLIDDATTIGSRFFCQGKDFYYEEQGATWSWSFGELKYKNLPHNALALQNMSTVLMAITAMQKLLPVNREAIDQGLQAVTLPGRIQIEKGEVIEIRDVSHNPASIALLAGQLKRLHCQGKVFAVFSMLADKDIAASVQTIRQEIDCWYVAELACKRAASKEILLAALQNEEVTVFSSMKEAYRLAKKEAVAGDVIVVFGSFHTVSEVFS